MSDATAPHRAQSTEIHAFLIADVRGYTSFTLEQGDDAAARLASRFAVLMRDGVSEHNGEVIELRGDEALAVFTSARQALRAALDLQDRFIQEGKDDLTLPLRVGIGLDAGEAIPVEGGYRGAALNLAARLCALAGPGEVLASDTMVSLARKMTGLEYEERGMVNLKGFADPIRVVQVNLSAPVPPSAPPSNAPDSPGAHRLRSTDESEDMAHDQHLPIGGFLGSLPIGVLVARDAELRSIHAAIGIVAGGEGRMIFLAGEPGVGKTRLAQEATMVSRNRGFLIAAGSCYEARQSTAFYPFLEALTTIYAQCPAAVRARVPREWPYLATLLPNENLTAPHVSGNQEDQERLFFAVTGFLHAVARETPVALLLDDLHWGDESSLQLLHYIAHHTRSHRVLIVGTYRDVEINRKHPLETTLRELSRQGLFERILVRRLAIEGTAALAAATIGEKEISDEFATILYRSTEGNPYFVQQVLRVLVERGAVFQADGTWDRKGLTEIEVPESVRSVIGQRLSRLSDTTQEILREASVLGQTFLFDDLLQLHGREEEDIESALEEAQVAGLVRETGRAGYGFDHALTQQSLYGELPSRRKRRLHVAAADVLDHLPGRQREKRIAELAWHLVEADESERALPYLLAAGDAAEAVFAHRDAEGHYRMALEMAEEAEDAAREADAVEKLGGVLVRVARLDEALEVLERAVSLRRNLVDIDGEYRATALIGRAHLVKGAAAEGIARLEPLATTALAVPADVRSRGTAALHSVLARLCWIDSQFEQSVFWAYEAANVARDLGDEEILAEAEVRRGTALSFLGRSEEALRVQEDALVLAERAGNPNHLHMALTNLGSTYMFYGDCGRQAEMRKRALAVVEQGGDVDSHLHALCGYALVLIIVGDWELARAHIERGMIMAQQLPNSWSASYALLSAGWLAAEQGKWTEARDLFDKLELIVQKTEDMQLLALMQEPLHELDLADGRPEACLKRILRILDSSRAGDMTETIVHHPLGETYLALGENEQALRLAEAAIELQSRRRYRFFLAPALRMKGEVLARRESWDEAEALFRESASLYHAMPQPYQEGITLYRWGHMLAARGNFIGARERLEAALATFTRLGANAYIQRTMDARAGLLDT